MQTADTRRQLLRLIFSFLVLVIGVVFVSRFTVIHATLADWRQTPLTSAALFFRHYHLAGYGVLFLFTCAGMHVRNRTPIVVDAICYLMILFSLAWAAACVCSWEALLVNKVPLSSCL